MFHYAHGVPMRLWVGCRWLLPREEKEWAPRTSRHTLWFYRDDQGGCLWYAINRFAKDLAGWFWFPGVASGDYPMDAWEGMLMAKIRKVSNTPKDGAVRVPIDKVAAIKYPTLWEHLTLVEYPETGEPRKTSTITLFLGNTGLTACLSDKDNGRTCFAASGTLLGLLEALEAAAADDDTVWREDKLATGSSARKK